jgi:hypothetical protein
MPRVPASVTLLGFALCALLLGSRPGLAGTEINHDAGLALSPYSETADRLKIRTVAIQADVRNGLAATKLTTVFSNTIPTQCQASLDLTVPPDSVVTGYAYWFKGERIQAKLLDNDKAWEIYSTITSHHRDPAIMEQWYDTTYHLQIYPVEPQKDLRVEVSYVSPLESDENGFYYRLPLAAGPSKTKLDRFSTQVTFHGVETSRISDGESLTPQVAGDRVTYSAVRERWQPEQDWVFRIQPGGRRHESYGEAIATSPGRGYFSLVLWTARALHRPQIRMESGRVRAVHQRGFTREVPAGRRLVVEGRYVRPGKVRFAFRDRRMNWTRAVLTLPARGGPVIPKKLWAASEIKRLSGALGHWEQRPELAGAKRQHVIRTSLDYGVMSPYTAWLAVPKTEYEFYLKTKKERRVETNADTARGGDPLIRITATPDVIRVTALLPTGEPVPMASLPKGVWEGRFDMPAETAEGLYQVVLLIERADGTVKRVTLGYRIDRKGPAGRALAERDGDTLRIRVAADQETKVAYLLLADGGKRFLKRDEQTGEFSGECPVFVLQNGAAEIVLVDGAHNVTRLRLDPR